MPALLAVKVWGSKTGWPLAVMILSLAYLWEAGVMLMLSTLRSRADFDHVAVGTECLLVGRRSCCSGSRTRRTHGRWAWPRVWWLGPRSCCSVSRSCCSGSGSCRTDGNWWASHFLLIRVATLPGGVAALLDGWTLV